MNKNALLELFQQQSISFDIYDHAALYTVKDSIKIMGNIEGAHTKNLFLKNKKNQFFLIACLQTTKIDLKKLQKKINIGNISFAKDKYLRSLLGVEPGAVNPFGLLNDVNNEINFFLDIKITFSKKVNFHPLVNTSTVTLNTNDFIKFMKINNKLVNILNFDNYSVVNE